MIDVILTTLAPLAGLEDLWKNVLSGWIGPIFLAAVAIFAIVFIKDRAWMKLLSFVGIAAIVGVLIFGGDFLFGDTGIFKTVAQDTAGQIGDAN